MRSLASHGAKGAANAKGRNYKRERVIGRGSFGTAYLVRCRTDSGTTCSSGSTWAT